MAKISVTPSLLILGASLSMGIVVACRDNGASSIFYEPDKGGTLDAGRADAAPPPSAPTAQYGLSGTITGLGGAGLVLMNGSEKLAIPKNTTTFAFKNKVAKGATFAVSAETQPTVPSQTCVVTNGAGTANADVTNITVACTTNAYEVSVNVVGAQGTGLVLQNNGGNDLAVAPGTESATFTTKVKSGEAFAVTVKTQPASPAQSCSVAGGAGTVVAGRVESITVNCTNTYTVSGTVNGLSGSGLVLQNNGGDDVVVSATSFAFPTPIVSGEQYSVAVKSGANPTSPWQTCTVTSGGSGLISANVTDVVIDCTTDSHFVRGKVNGLTGTGLVLTNNGGDDVSPSQDGTFAFTSPVLSGTSYDVQVKTSPTSPWQTCIVTGGTGTIANLDIDATVDCTTTNFNVGGKVSGLRGGGLVVSVNGTALPAFNGNGPFNVALPSGATYEVKVETQPTGPAQTCNVKNGSGVVEGADITNVNIGCSIVFFVHATSTAAWVNDVVNKLVGTSAFSNVITFDGRLATPTLAQIQEADVALVSSDSGFSNPVGMGDVLADYFDAGGRVVVATFANASVAMTGRWATGGYHLIDPTGQNNNPSLGTITFDEPNSPLAADVTSLTATSGYHSTGSVINGGVVVIRWGDGAPLIVRGSKNGRNYTALNMYPPSADVRPDFWKGSGAELMRNALLFE